jgi:hypothetical protein
VQHPQVAAVANRVPSAIFRGRRELFQVLVESACVTLLEQNWQLYTWRDPVLARVSRVLKQYPWQSIMNCLSWKVFHREWHYVYYRQADETFWDGVPKLSIFAKKFFSVPWESWTAKWVLRLFHHFHIIIIIIIIIISCYKLRLEAWVVGFTTGSRGEVPGKKENLWQELMMMIIIIIKMGWEVVDWTDLTQDRTDDWRASVSSAKNFRFP